eukprot:1541569-Pyramimonas_sp.AAC.1
MRGRCRAEVGFTSGEQYVQYASPSLLSSVAFGLKHTSTTSGMYGAWVATVESAILQHHGMAAQRLSRASGPQFR